MKANISIENIWFNSSLQSFFFRSQSYNTLVDLVNRCEMSEYETIEHIDEYYENSDLDDVEEMFYNESVEYIANDCGLTLNDE